MPACPMGENCCQNMNSEVETFAVVISFLNDTVQLPFPLTFVFAFHRILVLYEICSNVCWLPICIMYIYISGFS